MFLELVSNGWVITAGVIFFILLTILFVCARYIPNDRVGVVEKLWSSSGSLGDGEIIALNGEAGYQAELLRGGIHLWLWRWQYSVHKLPLIMIRQGKIGYIFSRAGAPLEPSQTLGKIVDCSNFQDAKAFLANGQKGRQRGILREGVYSINLALFHVITEDHVYALERDKHLEEWQASLKASHGFDPIVVGGNSKNDNIGIITTHDGPSLTTGEIIAPAVGGDPHDPNFHNNYQDIEKFLLAGGRRGLQYAPLIDGTYFINRWFATVELIPKQVVPIGSVGVVVSYYGQTGHDVSGASFRHGERVKEGERGVREIPLGPGKYAFNTYAGNVVLVPTTNFVLHWITGRNETHKYDDTLKSIDLVTRDAYEPSLPLSVVVHIDYQRAPSVIQRFGDVKQLITQTLDPLLSAFFRDVAHKKSMLELIHCRDEIQEQARSELRERFKTFDIECVDVLIGKPDTGAGTIEGLLDQLRLRQFSIEQMETYKKQEAAAAQEQSLNQAKALAEMQTELTNSKIQIEIAGNEADAELARAKKLAERTVVLAKADSEKSILEGAGLGQRTTQIGLAEAEVLLKKIASFGDPRLYAMSVVTEFLANSKQPLVPAHLFLAGGDNAANGSNGMMGQLIQLLVAEKSGFKMPAESIETSEPVILEPQAVAPVAVAAAVAVASNGDGEKK